MDAVVHRCTLLIGASALFAAAALTMARRQNGLQTTICYLAICWLFAVADSVNWMVDAFRVPLSSADIFQSLLAAPLSLLVPTITLIIVCLIRSHGRQSITRILFVAALPCCIAMVDLVLLLVESSVLASAADNAINNAVR